MRNLGRSDNAQNFKGVAKNAPLAVFSSTYLWREGKDNAVVIGATGACEYLVSSLLQSKVVYPEDLSPTGGRCWNAILDLGFLFSSE